MVLMKIFIFCSANTHTQTEGWRGDEKPHCHQFCLWKEKHSGVDGKRRLTRQSPLAGRLWHPFLWLYSLCYEPIF